MDDSIRIKISLLDRPEASGVYKALNIIIDELVRALEKHPDFPAFGQGQADVIMEEVGEWAEAAKAGNWDQANTEAAHAAVVLIRAMCAPEGVALGMGCDSVMARAMAYLGQVAKDINDDLPDYVRAFDEIKAVKAVADLEVGYED